MDAKFDPTAEATVSLETWVAVSGGFEDSPLEGTGFEPSVPL